MPRRTSTWSRLIASRLRGSWTSVVQPGHSRRARSAPASKPPVSTLRTGPSSAPKRAAQASIFRAGTLESASFPEQSFQVITLFDVIEHVHSPNQALASVHRWLSPGGLLVMSLPNVDSWVAKAMGKHWVLLLREHLWYFSPDTVARLLQRAGFELVQTRPKWVSFSFANIATRLAQYPGALAAASGKLVQSQLLRRAYARFPMGEMDVVARRAL